VIIQNSQKTAFSQDKNFDTMCLVWGKYCGSKNS